MSIVVELYCDGESCVRNGESFYTGVLTTSVRDLRADAKLGGWVRAGKKDYCNYCAQKMKDKTP